MDLFTFAMSYVGLKTLTVTNVQNTEQLIIKDKIEANL